MIFFILLYKLKNLTKIKKRKGNYIDLKNKIFCMTYGVWKKSKKLF